MVSALSSTQHVSFMLISTLSLWFLAETRNKAVSAIISSSDDKLSAVIIGSGSCPLHLCSLHFLGWPPPY